MSLVPAAAGLPGEVGLGHDGEPLLGVDEAPTERAGRHVDEAGRDLLARRVERRGDVVLAEDLVDAASQAVAVGDDDDAPAVGDPAPQLGHGRLGVAPEGLDVGGREVDPLDEVVIRRVRELRQLGVAGERRQRPPRQVGGPGVLAQLGQGPERRRPQHALEVDRDGTAGGRAHPAGLEELGTRRDEVVCPGADALGVDEDDERASRQQVEHRLHTAGVLQQDRHQRLHALDGDALGQLGQHVPDPGQLAGELPGPLADGVGEEELAAGRRPQAVLGDLEAALVGHLEPADLLDRVTPELDPDRVLLGRREDVEDPAADGELAAALDEVGPRVGGRGESVDDVLERRLVSRSQRDRRQLPEPAGHRLQDGPHRRDDDGQRPVCGVGRVRMRETAQHGEASADGVAARAEPLVRERLPARERRDAVGREQAAERLGEVVRLAGRRRDEQDRRLCPLWPARAPLLVRETGHDERPGSAAHRDVDEREPGAGRLDQASGVPAAGPGGTQGSKTRRVRRGR